MTRKILTITIGLFFISTSVFAQSNDVNFPSSQLQQMSLRYAGTESNWPILVNLATHNIQENTFTLSPSNLLQLKSLSETSTSVQEQEEKVKTLISSGATIFAKDELLLVNEIRKSYSEAIQRGDLERTLEQGVKLAPAVTELESTLTKNRLVAVQAQLTEKEGNVDKRLGLLGSWKEAIVDDLFKESDGLKTYDDSFANLAFTDGSSVIVNPNTTAVIRKSRIDKLDESSDTEISLVQGGLLAKLSAAGKERSKYIINAGSSSSELNSQNFYAESDGASTVRLTNYDGQVDVNASDITISLKKNEGTIVKKGSPPADPIQLLAAPETAWASKDSIIYRNDIVFSFQAVPKATSYILQSSSSRNFDRDIVEIALTSSSTNLRNLDLGTTYVRVQAVDNLGLRGPFSENTRIIKNEDNQPPALFIDDLNGSILFTKTSSALINGTTEPSARLTINGRRIATQLSGKFVYQLQNLEIDQKITLTSTDESGNVTEEEIRVVQLTENQLFNISLSGASGNDIVKIFKPSVTLSGDAYPGLEILIINEGNERRVQADSRGKWGITMNMQEGKLSITFKDIKSGVSYLTKSFTVQAR